ncbi:MAG: bifunctional hydroxymethylpyrimidine kinase/phosphomethylpyrimidine kinase [Acidimicrobiales bacterium]
MRRLVALTIAGSDSGGGAGIAADLKTFQAYGVWGTVAVTAVTAQNTLGVQAYDPVTPELVRAQIASVMSDIGVDAAKTGVLPTADVVEAVASTLVELGAPPLVVDPVAVSTQGHRLAGDEVVDRVRALLVPLATVVTPNLAEAAALTGMPIVDRAGMEVAAQALVGLGAQAVLLTGGHLDGESSPDCLVVGGADGGAMWLEAERLGSQHTHGTGCVLSAAICAGLARGTAIADACVAAKRFVEQAIRAGVELGSGPGAVDPGNAGA